MRKTILRAATIAMLAASPIAANAQASWGDVFNKFKLEARADAELMTDDNAQIVGYGMHGRYFNLMVGGNLGGDFSYYFRQRIKAEQGSVHFFDNTDFLYVNYQPNESWRFRFGKDAMVVGGYEYDAPPIDEYMVSEYWNNFYCFQLAVSAAYTFGEGRQTVVAQVSQSPYINSLGLSWDAGLLAYNLQWVGRLGDHVNTLWSTSMIERSRGTFMNLTMLGTQVAFDRWDLYLDLMHHAHEIDDWFNNGGWVLRFNYHLSPAWTLFLKNSHEENHSPAEAGSPIWIDQLVPAGHSYTKTGLGFEYRPGGMQSLRIHAYAALLSDLGPTQNSPDYSLSANAGITWTMDIHNLFKK